MRDYPVLRIPGSGLQAKWRIRAYYNDTVKSPKQEDELAIEVLLADDAAKDFEVEVCKSRKDVYFDVEQVGP